MGNWRVYNDNGTPCYLVMVIYRDWQTGEKYAHSNEKLSELLDNLCKDDSVYDFKVFKRMGLEYEGEI